MGFGSGGSGGCFKSGSLIRSPTGDRAVEDISAGDRLVVIRDGREIIELVQWVGFTAIDLAKHAHVEDVAPIRIHAEAIGEGQPARDLFLSPEHCLIIDGRCVSAKLLVNGGSIVSERDHAPFTYYHVELENHGILLAENTPAESYLDTGNRSVFDNSGVSRSLHPTFKLDARSERWLTDACAPLASAAEVEAIWARVADRSASIGFAIPDIITVQDADVRIVADGAVIAPTSAHDSRYVFTVPAGVASVTLASRFVIPSDQMVAAQRDVRRLGVSVKWIAIRSEGAETIIPADHPALQDGWNEVEVQGKSNWRWTDGAATIPWENVAGPAVLTVCCAPADRYPLYNAQACLVA
jgi:hypothetical protein